MVTSVSAKRRRLLELRKQKVESKENGAKEPVKELPPGWFTLDIKLQ
jgi:hypothetical protein